MRDRGGRVSRRRSRRRMLGRQLLIAVPGLGLALILFAQAANNDLGSLRADAPPTTPLSVPTTIDTTIDPAGDPTTGSTEPVDAATPGPAPADPGPNTTAGPGGGPLDTTPGAAAPIGQAPVATNDVEAGITTRSTTGSEVTTATTGTGDAAQTDTAQTDTAQTDTAQNDTAQTDTAQPDAGGRSEREGAESAAEPTGAGGGDEANEGEDGGPGITGLLRTALTAIAIAASVAGTIYLTVSMIQGILQSRRRRADDGTEIEDEEDPQAPLIVIDASEASWTLEQLKARLEADPDPRSAIRHAYAAVESGFGAGGGLARRRTETPLQYLERTLGTMEESVRPLRTLTGLFLLARYSNRPITEAMRGAAIDAVVELQAAYRQAEGVAA